MKNYCSYEATQPDVGNLVLIIATIVYLLLAAATASFRNDGLFTEMFSCCAEV